MTLSWRVEIDWGVNMASNPGFETAGSDTVFQSWYENAGDGAVAAETTSVHGGTKAAALTAGAGASTYLQLDVEGVTAGRYYSVSFWTRGDGTNAGRYNIIDVTQLGSLIGGTSSTGITGLTYRKVREVVRVPTGCEGLGIAFYCPSTAGGVAYFDDVSVSEYQPEQSYVQSLDIQRGRSNVFERVKPGTARITIDNMSGRFDPWDVTGPLYPYIKPGRPVLIRVLDVAASEMVVNGDMAIGNPPSNWTGVNATLAQYAGGATTAISVAATSDNGYAKSDAITVEPGRWYELDAWALPSAAGHNAHIRVYDETNGANAWVSDAITVFAYLPVRGEFRAPVGCTSITVRLAVDASGETAYFDNVSVKPTSAPLFHGKITDLRPTGGVGSRQVVIDAVDGINLLEAKNVYADYRASSTADVCIDDILDDVGWLGGDWRDLDTGDVTVRNFWGGGSALDAINQLVDAEHGAFFISADGAARFMDRTTYIGTTAVGALDEDDIVDIMPTMPWDHIRNEIIVKGNIVKAWATTQECAGNGDMEIGSPPGAWTASDATLTRYTASVHGGSAALSVAVTSNGGYAYQQLSVSAGESVTFSGWMRSSAAGHRCRYRVRDVTNSTDIYDSGYTDNTSWNQKTNTFTVPAGCRVIRVICQVETNGETAYFDDVSVTAVGREIWNYEEKPTLAAGETITLWAEYQDENGKWCPAKNVRDAAAYIDYTANTAEDGTGTDMTGSLSVTTREYSTTSKLIVSNTHASTTLYITMLRLRGASLRLVPIQVKAEDVTSQETYGKRSHVVDTPFLQTQAAAKTLATALETYYDDPINAPTVRMQHRFPVAVGFDLLENIAFTAPTYSLNETKRIGLIHHWTETSMNDLWTEWTFEPVPS